MAVERRRVVDGWRNRDLKKSELSQGGLEKQDREANPRGRDCRCGSPGRDVGARTVEVSHGVGFKKSERWWPVRLEGARAVEGSGS